MDTRSMSSGRNCVTLKDSLVQLRPRALALLLELARRAGEVVTKRDLMARVWPNSVVTDDSLVQCVVEIRRELGDAQQRVLRTVPRRGYLLMADDEPAGAATATKSSWYRGRRAEFLSAGMIVLVALAALGLAVSSRDDPSDRGPLTIAVLPLRQIEGAVAADGLGLAYMVSGELARNPDLRVVSTLVTADLLSIAIDSGLHPEEAVQAAERAVELGPGDPDNWLALGLAQYHARRIDAGLRSVEKAVSWNRTPAPVYAIVEARLRYAVQDYPAAVRKARECMERAPAAIVCKAIWLSSQVRIGHVAEAQSEWGRLVKAAPTLENYHYAPRDTPEARAIEQDLDQLRRNPVVAAP
jgi:DNA-binding winged helix-turn-helix (wHTH) protein